MMRWLARPCKILLRAGFLIKRGYMDKEKVAKFAHLQYCVLHELEISIAEYWYLDMVFQLSRFGWCNKKLDNIAADMRMSKRGVMTMRNRLVKQGLIVKGTGNRVKTSEKVNKVYFSESSYEKSALNSKKVHKVHPKSAQSVAKTPVENNKRLTKNRFFNKTVENSRTIRYKTPQELGLPNLR